MELPNYIPGDKAAAYKDKVIAQNLNYVPGKPVEKAVEKNVEKPAEKITAKKPKGE